jgi:hypothetical protein
MSVTYQVEPLDRDDLDEILRDYVCSTCWGALAFRFEDGKWFAICPECGEETKGYTSKNFAERKRQESEGEFFEAERNLRSILGLTRERQTIKQNLSDLGF